MRIGRPRTLLGLILMGLGLLTLPLLVGVGNAVLKLGSRFGVFTRRSRACRAAASSPRCR